jgi:thiol-disulfide isomerase/thioredoxin
MIFYNKYIHLGFRLLILFCIPTIICHAQNAPTPTVNLGDLTPPMRIAKWVKGSPIYKFEKNSLYILEFWATWCMPCRAAMPHLSALAEKYKDNITVIGVDVLEKQSTSIERITKFVDSMGQRMNYSVAIQDSNFMETDWLLAAGDRLGIPTTFVVDRDGRLAWIGHPKDLEKILPKVINNTWDINEELNKRNLAKRLKELEDSVSNVLYKYRENLLKPGDLGKPDSALLVINAIIKKEPILTYAGIITYNTFTSLLKTNQKKALEYGRLIMVTPSYEGEPDFRMIIGAIMYSDKLILSPEIYQLGAEACEAEINLIPYPEIVDMYKRYHKMADWYWRAKNKLKAIEAEQKAIIALKSKTGFSKTKLLECESALQKYRRGNH